MLLPLLAIVAEAATFDPDLRWRTITTDDFRIHFHQGEEQLAEEFSRIVQEVHDRMLPEIRWKPRRRTEVVLVDRTDQANGYAQIVPYNTIVIYVTAPQPESTLALFDDWSSAIMTHEYTHVLHLDTNHALVRLARIVVGRVATTNGLSPWWMIEGFATLQETRQTHGGRGRTPVAEMIKRTAALGDAWPPLGNLDGLQAAPPGGNLRYLFGQDFMQFVADVQGEDVWTRWVHTYGSGLPYLLPGRRALGRRLASLYAAWTEARHAGYANEAAQVAAEGLREGERVSTEGASCVAPAFSPTGDALVWSCLDLRSGNAIWLADGAGRDARVLVQDRGATHFTWRIDGKALAYSANHVVNRFNTWSDVFLYTLDDDRLTALTAGARARDPEFSPDGSRLLVVTNRVQDNQLEVLTVDRRRTALTAHDDHTQLSSPRYAPDGRVVALVAWKEGRWDLWLYSPEGEPLRRLTSDAAIESAPRWSADGRWLYFASDRSGIPNVYAVEIATERLFQVTNVTTGAMHPAPSPDGRLLAYQHYAPLGWEVRVMDLDPSRFLDRGLLPAPLWHHAPAASLTGPGGTTPVAATAPEATWEGSPIRGRVRGVPHDPLPFAAQQPGERVDTFVQTEAGDVFGEEWDYPFTIRPTRYDPLRTLTPRYWLPFVQLTPDPPRGPLGELPVGLFLSASTGGTDVLRRYGWAAGATYRSDADFFGGYASVTLNRWLPVYAFGVRADAVPLGPVPLGDGVDAPTYWDHRRRVWATVSYPYTWRTTVFARYELTHRAPLDALPDDVVVERLPTRGYVARLLGGWRYAWAKPTPFAISTEDGRVVSVVGGLLHPWLGTRLATPEGTLAPFRQVQLTGELREYVVNPWIPNHVVAFRGAAGVTVGPTDRFGSYHLGGSFGEGAFFATPEEFRMLRGYPLRARIGDMFWLGSLEYRLPLWRIERGFGTIPAFFRYVSGVLFLDAGNAFTRLGTLADAVDDPLVGTGMELRLTGVYAWSTPITARVGYGVGLTQDGVAPTDPRAFYLQIGGSF